MEIKQSIKKGFVQSKSLTEIANVIDGELVFGTAKENDLLIDSIAVSPDLATENDLVFIYEKPYFKLLAEQKIKAKALIIPTTAKNNLPFLGVPVIWVDRPRLVLKKLLELFSNPRLTIPSGVHQSAVVDSSAMIEKKCSIGANVFIGANTKIGEGTVIYPNVFISSNVVIGKNCVIKSNCSIMDYSFIGDDVILHSGVVIGSDGYSYVTEGESNLEKAKRGDFNFNFGRQVQHKIPSLGGVVIEDSVEIGANSCVDAGTIGPTIVGEGTKIDNLVQVAHNCKIGKDCLIVGQVGFAGSVKTGDRVVAGGQSGFADNIEIGNDVIFVAKSAVHGNIPSNNVYMGVPAVPYKEYFKNEQEMKRLPRKYEKLEEQVKLLEVKVKELEEKSRVGV